MSNKYVWMSISWHQIKEKGTRNIQTHLKLFQWLKYYFYRKFIPEQSVLSKAVLTYAEIVVVQLKYVGHENR